MPEASSPLLDRLAGAPISWGVCEVPGWGVQMSVERVLAEMREVGLVATELGAAGWLPPDAPTITALLAHYDLRVVAGFVPLVLHDAARLTATLETTVSTAQLLRDVGATCFVTCAVADLDDWSRPTLSEAEWTHLYGAIERVGRIAAASGLTQVVHPHVDSLIERADEVERVLNHTYAQFCLDTGHLSIGGFDPVDFAERYASRVGLVHLKDVRLEVAERLRRHELTLMGAVQAGIFTPLGGGDVALDGVVAALERSGYDGWYVFEQDAALTAGEPPRGEGPIADVRASIEYLRALDARLRQGPVVSG